MKKLVGIGKDSIVSVEKDWDEHIRKNEVVEQETGILMIRSLGGIGTYGRYLERIVRIAN